jgi:hypothetical protein
MVFDGLAGYSQDADAVAFVQHVVSSGIRGEVVVGSVDFDTQRSLMAIEVDDERIEDVLTSKLAAQPPLSNLAP